MTIEQFRAEYHLLDRVSDGTVETHHAQAAAGVMVMVHFLRGTESRNAAMLERIERLETERRQKVLRIIEVDGVTAVVTRFILDLTSFEDWLGVDGTPADPAPPDHSPAERSATLEAGATTPRASPADRSANEPAAATPGAPGPGEFTRLFAPPPFPPTGVPTPEVGPPGTSKPGEPGEYTRMVNPHIMPEPRTGADRPPSFPGPRVDEPLLRPAGAQQPQYDTDNYRERLAAPSSGASPFPPPPPAAPPPPPPVVPTGPSEFTKVVEPMPTPGLGQPAPPLPAPPRPKAPPATNKLLVLALLGVLLAAILFVVIFAILT